MGTVSHCLLKTILTCIVLTAPKSYADPLDLALTWASSKTAHHPQAVDKLVLGFFHADGLDDRGDDRSTSMTIGRRSGSLYNPDIDFVKIGKSDEIQFSISSPFQKFNGFYLRYSLDVSQGATTYFLPDGIKPFLDPMTLNIKHQTAQIEVITLREWTAFDLYLGAGFMRTWSKSRLSSALLDVPSRHTFSKPYATAGIDYFVAKSPISLGLKLNSFPKGQFSLETRLRIATQSRARSNRHRR